MAALAQGVGKNSSLYSLTLREAPKTNAAIRNHLNSIRPSISINRVGGLRLLDRHNPVPTGLWASVLSRSSFDPWNILCPNGKAGTGVSACCGGECRSFGRQNPGQRWKLFRGCWAVCEKSTDRINVMGALEMSDSCSQSGLQ